MITKLVAIAVGVVTLTSAGFGAVAFFQSREDALAQHLELSEYSETAKLENALKLTELEINYLLNMAVRSPTQDNQLQYLNAKRLNLETRLRALQGAG